MHSANPGDRRRLPLHILPNLVTCTSLSLGLVSTLLSMEGIPELAAWIILATVLLDKLDGTLARWLDAHSELGGQLDSLSDFLTFIVAPAVLFVSVLNVPASPFHAMPGLLVPIAAAILYTVCGAVRLARFNCGAVAGANPRGFFIGVPTTFCGAFAACAFLVANRYLTVDQYHVALPALLILLSFLMVCPWYLPKLTRRKSRLVGWYQNVHLVIVPILVVSQQFPEYLLFLVFLYLGVGLTFANRKGAEIS